MKNKYLRRALVLWRDKLLFHEFKEKKRIARGFAHLSVIVSKSLEEFFCVDLIRLNWLGQLFLCKNFQIVRFILLF